MIVSLKRIQNLGSSSRICVSSYSFWTLNGASHSFPTVSLSWTFCHQAIGQHTPLLPHLPTVGFLFCSFVSQRLLHTVYHRFSSLLTPASTTIPATCWRHWGLKDESGRALLSGGITRQWFAMGHVQQTCLSVMFLCVPIALMLADLKGKDRSHIRDLGVN